jgi:hypothetical protein
MTKKRLAKLVLSCLMVLASCSGDDSESGGAGAGAGAGGGGGGQSGNGGSEPCPAGLQCTAPAGAFVCTEPNSGTPPLCTDQTDCTFASCIQFAGKGYCTQYCGPTPVNECPAGSTCTAFESAFVCAQSGLQNPPSCETESCPFGECLVSYNGSKLCLQPCNLSVVEQCPAGTICRSIGLYGWICAEVATALPPLCQSQADCVFGTCIASGDQSYCTEYCTQPTVDITGVVLGASGELLGGVEVCVFENGNKNLNLCTTTNAQGQFALYELPEEVYFILSMSKSGYQSNLQLAFPYTTTSGLMFTEGEIAASAQAVQVTYPAENTGSLAFVALDTSGAPVAGYSVSISPSAGSGPFYGNASDTLDNSLTSSSATGWGVFFNLPAGSYSLDFSHASMSCQDPYSQIMVESGYLSYVITACL